MEHITFEQCMNKAIDIMRNYTDRLTLDVATEETIKVAKQIYNADPTQTSGDNTILFHVSSIIANMNLSIAELLDIEVVKQKVSERIMEVIDSEQIAIK